MPNHYVAALNFHLRDAVADIGLRSIDGLAAAATGCDKSKGRVSLLEFECCSEVSLVGLPAVVAAIHEQRFSVGDVNAGNRLTLVVHYAQLFYTAVEAEVQVADGFLTDAAAKRICGGHGCHTIAIRAQYVSLLELRQWKLARYDTCRVQIFLEELLIDFVYFWVIGAFDHPDFVLSHQFEKVFESDQFNRGCTGTPSFISGLGCECRAGENKSKPRSSFNGTAKITNGVRRDRVVFVALDRKSTRLNSSHH